jgi:hypothetical protein
LLLQFLAQDHVVSPLESRTPGFACTPRERNPMESSQGSEGARLLGLQASSFTYQRPWCVNKAFPDMGVLTKYDQTEPIYVPHSVVTYIYLHPLYVVSLVL